MHARKIRFAIAVLFATIAWGQAPNGQSVTQVFHFTTAQTPQEFQQITNAIRSLGEITQASLNADAKTLAVTGTSTQTAMAAWIFSVLDQPVSPNPAAQEYRPAGTTNDVLRILYLTHSQGLQSLQEIVNAVRTIPDISRLFPYSPLNAMVMRVTDSEAAMADWLVHQLDLPAGLQPAPPTGQTPTAHQYQTPGAANDIVQVYYLTHAGSTQSFLEIVNTLRAITQLTRVFPSITTGTVALRGTAAQTALATWLFNQLDQPATGQTQFQMPGSADDVTQVYHLTPTTTAQSLQSIVNAIRSTLKSQPVFPDTSFNAITLRGTATQIAAADVLIKQMNQP